MKSPKEPKPKVAVKKLSKIIKGSGMSQNPQSYLSLDKTNQHELPPSKKQSILPPSKKLSILPAYKKLSILSPIIEEDKYIPIIEEDKNIPIIEEDKYIPIIEEDKKIPITVETEEETRTNKKEFTYKKLLIMFETELLYNETNKLKSKAEEIAEEIAEKIKGTEKIKRTGKIKGTEKIKRTGKIKRTEKKEKLSDYNIINIQNIFNKTVENEIKKSVSNLKNKVDEELRKRLLNILYTANFGYSKDSEPIVIKDYEPIVRRGGGKGGLVDIEYWNQLWGPDGGNDLVLNFQNEGFGMFGQPIDLPVEARSSSSSPKYAQQEEEESEEESNLRKNIVTNSSYFIFPWKDFLLNVFKYLYYFFEKPQLPDDNPETIEKKKKEIKRTVINAYQSGSEMQKIMEEEFERVDYYSKRINKSILNRLTIDEEIKEYREGKPKRSARALSPTRESTRKSYRLYRTTLLQKFLQKYMPTNSNGVVLNDYYKQTIYTPGGYEHITIQFYNTFDRKSILKNMLFLLYKFRKFTTFINLLDCVRSENIEQKPLFECNPYDKFAIHDMIIIANNMLKDAGAIDGRIRKFYNIKNLESMKAGDLETWYQINELPKKSSKKLIGIFHSYYQRDNAGIILLFLKLRDARTRTSGFLTKEFVRNGLNKVYFGLPNIIDLINKFKDLFKEMHPIPKRRHRDYNYVLSYYNSEDERKKREHEERQKRENEFDREYYNEIFETEKIWHIKLLRQRLNRIFYFLAKNHKIKEFYLYTCHPSSKYNKPYYDDEKATPEKIKELFSISFIVNIDWGRVFNDTDLNTHQRWVDGIL